MMLWQSNSSTAEELAHAFKAIHLISNIQSLAFNHLHKELQANYYGA